MSLKGVFDFLQKVGPWFTLLISQVAAKLLKGILIKIASDERERLMRQREDVMSRFTEQKKRQEEEKEREEEEEVKIKTQI